jgi:hypothetical protein
MIHFINARLIDAVIVMVEEKNAKVRERDLFEIVMVEKKWSLKH